MPSPAPRCATARVDDDEVIQKRQTFYVTVTNCGNKKLRFYATPAMKILSVFNISLEFQKQKVRDKS